MSEMLAHKYRALTRALGERHAESVSITMIGPRDMPDTVEILRATPHWPPIVEKLLISFREETSGHSHGPALIGSCDIGMVIVEYDGDVGSQSLAALTHEGRAAVNVYAEPGSVEISYAHDGEVRAWADTLHETTADASGPDGHVLTTALRDTPWADEPQVAALMAAERIVGFGPDLAWLKRPHRVMRIRAPRDGLVPDWLQGHPVLDDPMMRRILDDPHGHLRAISYKACELVVAARSFGEEPLALEAMHAIQRCEPDAALSARLKRRRDNLAERFLRSRRRGGAESDREKYLDGVAWEALLGALHPDPLTAAGRVLYNAGRGVLTRAIVPGGEPFTDEEVWLFLLRRCERRVFMSTERSRSSAVYY